MRVSVILVIVTLMGLPIVLAAYGAEKPLGTTITKKKVTPRKEGKVVGLDENLLPIVKEADIVLRDRLAAGILKWQTLKNHRGEKVVVWNECGKRVPEEEVEKVALEWASNMVRAANESAEIYGWRINLWGVMGTAANESSFDRCAIGRHTREWAYKEGLLKNKRFTWISHSKKDVLKLVKTRKWKNTWKWVDAGALQVLWKRIYRGPLEDMLTLNPGLDIGIQEMQRRSNHYEQFNARIGQRYFTKWDVRRATRLARRSWRLWPGTGLEGERASVYDKKVTKFARKMGALSTEI